MKETIEIIPSPTDTTRVLERLSQYAGLSMDSWYRPRNPNITAREAIVIANELARLRLLAGEHQ